MKRVEFEGAWQKLIGNPEIRGSWLVWGKSSNGKTRFALQLAKYLTKFGKVAYNSLEEGDGDSMVIAFREEKMNEVGNRISFLVGTTFTELVEYLRKQRSEEIIITDSLQYFGLNAYQYERLQREFANKLFIWISHAEGKEPEGRLAKRIRYDVPVKIRIEGYKAFCQSRFGTTSESYIIWPEGAENYWGKKA